MTPFSFAIELVAFASRREYFNLETWLNDNFSTHRDTLFQVMVLNDAYPFQIGYNEQCCMLFLVTWILFV